MVYGGTTSQTINFTISQGLADHLYDTIDTLADPATGMIADQVASLEGENKDKSEKIATITARAHNYEEHLIDYYASLETKIAAAKTTLSLLEAILDSNKND
jgi:flagellar hook-associated protein 2